MSNRDHLDRETNLIPIKEHNTMLLKQYTLTCHLPDHINYSLVYQEPPERNLRKYAAREYQESIECFISRGGLNQANLKVDMKSIPTVNVRSAINNYSNNPITANRPPPIDGLEQELPTNMGNTDTIEIGMLSYHQPLHVQN